MGFVIDINDHLSVELRRASFYVHDDELEGESPEFSFRRVFPLEAAIETIKKSERFQTWLRKEERNR